MASPQTLPRARRHALWSFAVASLLAIGIGAAAMLAADVPISIALRNLIAWVVAGAFAILAAARGWLGGWSVPVAAIVTALSFVGSASQGVHRWLDLGPVQLNAAALILPLAIATFARTQAALAALSFTAIAALLAWQPDISQLAGLVPAALILAHARFGWRGLAIAAVISGAAVALCLSRPDPLAPVAHVEGIFALAWTQSPALALAMAASLAAAALSPLLERPTHPAALALAAYFAATAIAPTLGAYPVPLAGYGLSFVIGWWLAIAALPNKKAA